MGNSVGFIVPELNLQIDFSIVSQWSRVCSYDGQTPQHLGKLLLIKRGFFFTCTSWFWAIRSLLKSKREEFSVFCVTLLLWSSLSRVPDASCLLNCQNVCYYWAHSAMPYPLSFSASFTWLAGWNDFFSPLFFSSQNIASPHCHAASPSLSPNGKR